MNCIEVEYSEDKERFLGLPKKLYDKNFLTQDLKTETQILNNSHPLSSDFIVYPYIVLREDKSVLARAVLTVYPNESVGYIGFFECIDSQKAADLLLNTIKNKAMELCLVKLIGPLDSSFWIKYRFKIDNFDNCYINEPYNKDYYFKLWTNWGFKVTDRYYSNQLRVPTEADSQEKCKQRLDMMKSKGYIFRTATKKSFEKDLKDIFALMKEVYAKFPMFKPISEEQFIELYSGLKLILNYDMIHLAYKSEELVGFFISIPNYGTIPSYGNGLLNLNVLDFIKILNIKTNPTEYVMLYMGASPDHPGLGGAFAELVKNYLQEHKCRSVGALIHEGNTSGVFYKNLIVGKYEYVLMEYNLTL